MNINAGRARPFEAPRGPSYVEGVAIAIGAIVTVAIAVAFAYPESLARPFLLAGLAIAIPLPIVVRAVQGKLDLLEPIVFFVLGHLSLYLARPIAQLAYGQDSIAGIPIMGSFNTALAISLVGVLAAYAGYALPAARGLATRLPSPPKEIPQYLTFRVALFTAGLGLLLWGVFLIQSGGLEVFFTYIEGRSAADKPLFRASSGYFYLAPFALIPASLMLLDSNARRASALALLTGVFCFVFILVITGPRGDRSFLLLIILPLIAQYYLRKGTRPNPMTTVVAVLVAIVIVNVLVSYRALENRDEDFGTVVTESVTDPAGQLEQFVLGPDTLMFPLTALMVETLDEHHEFTTLTSLAASPVPGNLWPDKPRDPDVIFFVRIFPTQAAVQDAGNALGYLGSYWYDGSWPMLILYAMATALAFRILYEYLRRYPGYTGAQLIYSILLPFTIVLIRGNPTQTLPAGIFIFFPILVLLFLTRRATKDAPA